MTPDALVAQLEEKARKKAAKAGVDTEGALMVAHDLGEKSSWVTLVVWPDRVEATNHGQVGTFTRKGAGTETMPIANIASVQTRKKVLSAYLQLHGSGNSIDFKTTQPTAEALRTKILELMHAPAAAAQAAPAAPAADDPYEQLRKLGELHQAGILTDEEYSAKKAALLARM